MRTAKCQEATVLLRGFDKLEMQGRLMRDGTDLRGNGDRTRTGGGVPPDR